MGIGFREAAKQAYIAGYDKLLRVGIASAPQPIIMLAHYRSGSSLLTRILASNPDILGWGESNTCYASERDFFLAEIKARRVMKKLFRPYRYTLDKVTNNELTPNRELLQQKPARIVILTREASNSLSSLLTIIEGHEEDYSRDHAFNYYRNRYNFLGEFADSYSGDLCIWVNYEDLITDSDTVLSALTTFLELPTPLSKKYLKTKIPWTHGDPSNNLRRGEIFDTKRQVYPELEPAVLDSLQQAHRQCCNHLAPYDYRRLEKKRASGDMR